MCLLQTQKHYTCEATTHTKEYINNSVPPPCPIYGMWGGWRTSCVAVQTKKPLCVKCIMRQMHYAWLIPFVFDCWVSPIIGLFLPKSSVIKLFLQHWGHMNGRDFKSCHWIPVVEVIKLFRRKSSRFPQN